MLSVGALPSSPNVMQTISWLCRIVQISLSPAAELENPLGRGGSVESSATTVYRNGGHCAERWTCAAMLPCIVRMYSTVLHHARSKGALSSV